MDYNSSGVLWSISAGYQENILERFEKNDKIQGQSSNFKVKYNFFFIELQTSVIPLFHQIFTEKIIFGIILMIQAHLQGQKVNFKVKFLKMSFLTNIIRNKYNNSFWCDFDYKIYF